MNNRVGGECVRLPADGDATYDVVVIGGGAAGLSGALALVRSRRSVLVVDGGRPRNAPAAHMHNYLSRDGSPPLELLAAGRAEVIGYGGAIIGADVVAVEPGDSPDGLSGFRVRLSDGAVVQARRLLVATGAHDVLPDVPGVAERWGRDVLHCPYCHGWEVRDQAIGILATGPMAVHSALLFRQLSADVVVFQHAVPELAAEGLEQLAARGVSVIEEQVTALEVHDDRLTGVRLRSGAVIPRQALVVASRLALGAKFIDMLGLETAEFEFAGQVVATYVVTDASGATNVAGVWAAGNVTDPSAQVISAAAAGLKAGAAINADMVKQETARAVDALRAHSPATPEPQGV